MNYREATAFLFSQLPMYQRSGKAAYKANLDNTLRLDAFFGHPHRRFQSIHVAGTNGKGSVSHMLASILQEAGYRTGLYTSPHLLDFRERIRVNGAPVPTEKVTDFVASQRNIIRKIQPSFFEMTVAMAFQHFEEEAVDIAVVETGMGGRLDSTNVLHPILSLITNISMDHAEFLGASIELIAAEKGGIIKPDTPLVLGPMIKEAEKVLRDMAGEKNAPLLRADSHYSHLFQTLDASGLARFTLKDLKRDQNTTWTCGLSGMYQEENLRSVLTAVHGLASDTAKSHPRINIPKAALRAGLEKVVENTGILGRWQSLGANPRSICDTAHNQAGIEAVVRQIRQIPYQKLHMIWGMVGDKDLQNILPLLPRDASYYFTRASIPRSLDEKALARHSSEFGLQGESYPDVATAYKSAQKAAGKNDLIFIGGSTFVVADILGLLRA